MKINNDFRDHQVLVVGSGISGIGAVTLLSRVGALPVLYDGNEKLTAAEVKSRLPEGVKAEIIIGAFPKEQYSVALAVFSPGVAADIPLAAELRRRGIPIWGELELGYHFAAGQIIAITGTNGKTTTTTLVGQIMKAHFTSAFVVGNIGKAYTDIALETSEDTVVVAEVSSFQLETIHRFAPQVSAILNITPDHLDRHKTFAGYMEMKEKIAQNQTQDDICVLNYENQYTREFGSRCPAKAVYFSSARVLNNGYYLAGEDIYRAWNGTAVKLLNTGELHLVGICNVENIMAAIAIAEAMQVPIQTILETVRNFQAVEHRIEFVAVKAGVAYYNDSKGTNPDAAIQGIKAMTRPTVLLAGGYDKQSEYDEWIEAFAGKVKALVLVGQTREAIAACAGAHGITNIILTETFEDALAVCTGQAEPGDAVLLSPACASWGMFPNYEVRGNRFKEYVVALAD